MRWGPRVYIGSILVLILLAGIDLWLIRSTSKAIVVWAQSSGSTSSQTTGKANPTPVPGIVDNSVHDSSVPRGTVRPGVQEPVTSPAAAACNCAEKQDDSAGVKKLADDLKERLAIFQWILGLIITVAGLFTVAQGIAAGFSTTRFLQQAEKDSEEIEQYKKEIAEKYPDVLEKLAKKRNDAQKLLEAQLRKASPTDSPDEGYNWAYRFYAAIPKDVRQEILSVEHALPYNIVGEDDPPKKFSTQLQRLARFYWSKFLYEDPLGFGILTDLERAAFLLGLGRESSKLQFSFQNDLGGVYTEFFRVKRKAALRLTGDEAKTAREEAQSDMAEAERAYKASKDDNPNQLRAFFNLAILEAEFKARSQDFFPGVVEAGALHQAVDYLTTGLQAGSRNTAGAATGTATGAGGPLWEKKVIPAYSCEANFNLGCYYARLAGLEVDQHEAHTVACLKALEEAAKVGLLKSEDVEREFMEVVPGPPPRAGDFYKLSTGDGPATKNALELLRGDLCRPKP
jgi:hypothetical protein